MTDDRTPDPDFVNLLEWELKSIMRRQESVNGASTTRRSVWPRLGTTLAIMVVSMLAGGAGTHAVTTSTGNQTAQLYIARGEALLEIAQTRLEHFARELVATQSLVEQGVVHERESRQIEALLVQGEAETEIRQLELTETLITGKEPNAALSAPLVGGTDFVTLRMAALRRPMQRRLELVVAQARWNQELVDAGIASTSKLRADQTEVVAAEEELTGLEKRAALRASFLAGELSAASVELQGMRFAAIAARAMALRQIEFFVEQDKRLRQLSERGVASRSELRTVAIDLRTVEAHVELANLELRILEQKLENESKE